MRYTLFSLMIVFVIAMATPEAWAETKKEEASTEVPQGWILVEEDILIVFVDEPGEHFHKAREFFLKKDTKAVAAEIREGAAFLKLEAGRATGDGKKALMASVNELEKLADGVEKGTVTSAKELDDAFARAEYALAEHHYRKAKESWAEKEAKNTGHDLKAAAYHLENAFAWAGHKLEAGTIAVIDGVRLVAGKLIEGVGWVVAEVGKVIDDIGKEIEKLGKVIEPKKKMMESE